MHIDFGLYFSVTYIIFSGIIVKKLGTASLTHKMHFRPDDLNPLIEAQARFASVAHTYRSGSGQRRKLGQPDARSPYSTRSGMEGRRSRRNP